MNDELQAVTTLLTEATAAVPFDYFQLPIAGLEDPRYRERVYCYELYHQMRMRWPSDFRFSLSGEVDKNGHPLVRGNSLDYAKPDFIVHVPGVMDHNLLVVEVKAFTLNREAITTDLD